jgi:hypothetical protein
MNGSGRGILFVPIQGFVCDGRGTRKVFSQVSVFLSENRNWNLSKMKLGTDYSAALFRY